MPVILDKKYVKSVFKALSIVELLDQYGELGVTEMSDLLDMDKSTTFRLLSTLKEKHYITINPYTQKYSNGGKFFILGQGVLRRYNVNPSLGLILKQLSEETKETANLAVMDGDAVLYLASRETEDIVKLADSIGKRRPLHCTAVGKAMLAFSREEHIRALYGHLPLTRYTTFTLTTLDDLLKDLACTRTRGYAVDNQEHNLNIRCAGIPLLNQQGVPLAAVSISMPQFRYEADPSLYDRCVQTLLNSAASLTTAIHI